MATIPPAGVSVSEYPPFQRTARQQAITPLLKEAEVFSEKEKQGLVIQNQYITEATMLGKVAMGAGYTSIPKLKSALEFATYMLQYYRLDINGEDPRAKCKDGTPEGVRPEWLVAKVKAGWKLGEKLDAVISKRMKTLRADGLGKAFSPCE